MLIFFDKPRLPGVADRFASSMRGSYANDVPLTNLTRQSEGNQETRDLQRLMELRFRMNRWRSLPCGLKPKYNIEQSIDNVSKQDDVEMKGRENTTNEATCDGDVRRGHGPGRHASCAVHRDTGRREANLPQSVPEALIPRLPCQKPRQSKRRGSGCPRSRWRSRYPRRR
ncbi:hypothetical protein TBK1r_52220 [Stieleria magnilauensis]|uniref:Uncharacterized protein n=1 Tax=Stieleria magnilauensis TaxID=2527963 RepID=A0ABX5XVZ7_9BACT|nr:hypothetical protein TBK1r_52220 [Planctomycetes bacterium TBK1r]